MKLRVLESAHKEALTAATWYEDRQAGVGEEFLAELAHVKALIVDEPLRFAGVESYRGSRNVRRALFERFPFVLVYEIQDDQIVIIAVSHTSRRPNYWQRRER